MSPPIIDPVLTFCSLLPGNSSICLDLSRPSSPWLLSSVPVLGVVMLALCLRRSDGNNRHSSPTSKRALPARFFVIAAVLITSAVLLFHHRESASEVIVDRWRHLGLTADRLFGTDHAEAIQQFWAPWATVMRSAQPTVKVTIKYPIKGENRAFHIPVPKEQVGQPRIEFPDGTKLSTAEVASLSQSHAVIRQALDAWEGDRYDKDINIFQGRGIVTVSGGKYSAPVLVMVRMLRETGSDLPVEIFVPNQEEHEPDVCDMLLEYDARCLVLTKFFTKESEVKVDKFQLKGMALLFSSFREAIFLDSDQVPIVDPVELFDTRAYRETGFITWPDFWVSSESPLFWDIAGFTKGEFPPNLPNTGGETGQIIVDKHRHLKSLMLAAYYNVWGPECFYPLQAQGAMGEGDKTTFHTAAYVLGLPWYQVPNLPIDIGRDPGRPGHPWHHSASLQYMPSDNVAAGEDPWLGQNPPENPKPAFLHANWPKLDAGKLTHGPDLTTEAGGHIRIWGSAEEQRAKLGSDLEPKMWTVMADMACRLEGKIPDWNAMAWSDVCASTRDHISKTFGPI